MTERVAEALDETTPPAAGIDRAGAETAAVASPSPPATPDAMAAEEVGLFAPVYPFPRLEIASGRGTKVVDTTGREYLDFASGIAVNALGHAHPGLARVVARQMKQLVHVSNLFANRPAIELAQALREKTGYERVFFCNSGAEAIEAALKFTRARAIAKQSPARDVLAFRGGFHGRTAFALSATWTPSYREPFEPLVPGVRFSDFNDVTALGQALDEGVAAVIVEPVQGESGAIPARREFLEALRARCTTLGIPLVFDEIQCGMGRSGRLLAAEHYGVRADVTVLSKALGGGLPLGAVLMTADAAQGLAPGQHGCTFGGGAAVTAAGAFVLEQVSKPSFLAAVRARSRRLMNGLRKLVAQHPSLADARGLGLLTAVVVAEAAPYDAPALVRAAREEGLLLVRGGERAVRLLPPLNVKNTEIDLALAHLNRAVARLEAEPALART
jgi:predicted acetylornithine/succinylornithine family transaminase